MTKKKLPEQLPPYLEIRNWGKFQATSKTGKPLPWCKLYSAQADDIEYQRLTTFERGVLHDLYLLRTRTARLLHNDPTWLTRTTNTLPRYNARFTDAIHTLIQRGFLTPVESVNLTCEREKESDVETEKERERESDVETPKAGDGVSGLIQTSGLILGKNVTRRSVPDEF